MQKEQAELFSHFGGGLSIDMLISPKNTVFDFLEFKKVSLEYRLVCNENDLTPVLVTFAVAFGLLQSDPHTTPLISNI